eukprot:77308_1
MSSLLYRLVVILFTFPYIIISTNSNHILFIFNDTTLHNDSYSNQFISKLLPLSSRNKHTIDCIQIIHQTDTKFISEKHTNCQHTFNHITHHSYPFDIHNIHQILLDTFSTIYIPITLLIISPNINNIQLFHIHDTTFTITTHSTFHDIISIQKHILSTTLNTHTQNRHLLQQTNNPTAIPTQTPTVFFEPTTSNPTVTRNPTTNPVQRPTVLKPTYAPTFDPTDIPTFEPTNSPSNNPTIITLNPTNNPSTKMPTNQPTNNPTQIPTNNPTILPTNNPSYIPTRNPTQKPTDAPMIPGSPTKAPTNPTPLPSNNPTITPTNNPTQTPTKSPTPSPTNNPTLIPTIIPTKSPSNTPTMFTIT